MILQDSSPPLWTCYYTREKKFVWVDELVMSIVSKSYDMHKPLI